jgi:hypothetical protein
VSDPIEESFAFEAWALRGIDLQSLDDFLRTGDMPASDREKLLDERAEAFRLYESKNFDAAMFALEKLAFIERAFPSVKRDKARRKQASIAAKRGGKARKRYSEADRDRWRQLAKSYPDTLSKSRRAELIAEKVGLPKAAVRTIRREIDK